MTYQESKNAGGKATGGDRCGKNEAAEDAGS